MKQLMEKIKHLHEQDPVKEMFNNAEMPRELLYSNRMIAMLKKHVESPEDHLLISAACQHLCRWEIPRENYPMNRAGYLLWRKTAHMHQAKLSEKLMREENIPEETIVKVSRIIKKEDLKEDTDVQLIEDITCLVFVESYLEEFGKKYDEEKLLAIVRKTMKKMSEQGIEWMRDLQFPESLKPLLSKL